MALPIVPLLAVPVVFLLLSQKKKTTPTPGAQMTATLPGGTTAAVSLAVPTAAATRPSQAVSSPGFFPSAASASAAINVPTSSTPVAQMTQAERIQKAQNYQSEVLSALQKLNVDTDVTPYRIAAVPSEMAIQYASGLVARMKADGFTAEASALDQIVQAAIHMVPAPAVPIVQIPGIPDALQAEVDNALKYCKDPAKLRAIADALLQLPGAEDDPNIQNTIQMLAQMAAQIEAQLITANAVQAAEQIMTANVPPVVVIPEVPEATVSPAPTPAPVAVAAPKSAVEVAADLMVAHLKRLQLSAGSVTAAKGREDKATVSKFQKLANLTADGKAGPGTLVAAAGFGQYELPLVMYWPTSANRQRVLAYRDALNALADKIESTNQAGSAQLRASALRERGQAGIVGGPLPA